MDYLHTFFTEEYELLYKQLGTKGAMHQSIHTVKSSLTTIQNEINEMNSLVSEFDGQFNSELSKSIDNISKELANQFTTLNDEYPKVEKAMNDIYDDLNSFDYQDQIYTMEYNNCKFLDEVLENMDKYLEDGETIDPLWQQYTDEKAESTETYTKAKEIIDAAISNIKANMEIIKSFNDSIAEIRISTSAAIYSTQGVSLDDIKNMSVEEKQALLQKIIDKMTTDYYAYIEKYKGIMQKYIDDSFLFSTQRGLFIALTGINPDEYLSKIENTNNSTMGFEILEFLDVVSNTKAANGKNPFECLDAYLNGESFKDSGLLDFYLNNPNRDSIVLDYYNKGYLTDEDIEGLWKEQLDYSLMMYANDNEGLDDYLKRKLTEYNNMQNDAKEFEETYIEAVGTGLGIMTYKEIQKQVEFDNVRKIIESGDYELKHTPAEVRSYLNDLGYYDEVNAMNYLTTDETNSLTYIIENQGPKEARDFINSLQGSLDRRKAYVNAYNVYDQAINGDNVVLEEVKMFFIGTGDASKELAQGLVGVVAPTSTMTSDDYAKLYMLELFSQDDSTRSFLMQAAYKGGELATKGATAGVLNGIYPGLGSAVTALSSYGDAKIQAEQHNSLEEVIYSGNVDDFQTPNHLKHVATIAVSPIFNVFLKNSNKIFKAQ